MLTAHDIDSSAIDVGDAGTMDPHALGLVKSALGGAPALTAICVTVFIAIVIAAIGAIVVAEVETEPRIVVTVAQSKIKAIGLSWDRSNC